MLGSHYGRAGVVGKTSQWAGVVERPSLRDGRGWEALPEVRKWS